ncbi:putative N6-adenine methyltransferase-domain-containing protein [Paraphysoderma sedebokerense]|nr:putative N6-adenine methyltransferase-domain-containing protein [Paraphysoderma sedebokerense]
MTTEDDQVQLSEHTLAVLQQFLKEQEAEKEKFEKLKEIAEKRFEENDTEADTPNETLKVSMELFKEDWQLSQFWYDDRTAEILSNELIRLTENDTTKRIACVSSPTVFVKLKELFPSRPNMYLFEYDTRFSIYQSSFIHYDYTRPTTFSSLPSSIPSLEGSMDVILADPPFLSEECWEKTAQSIKYLLKPEGKVVVCTGMVMRPHIERLVQAKMVKFRPQHKNGLSNEFGCFTTYNERGTMFQWA